LAGRCKEGRRSRQLELHADRCCVCCPYVVRLGTRPRAQPAPATKPQCPRQAAMDAQARACVLWLLSGPHLRGVALDAQVLAHARGQTLRQRALRAAICDPSAAARDGRMNCGWLKSANQRGWLLGHARGMIGGRVRLGIPSAPRLLPLFLSKYRSLAEDWKPTPATSSHHALQLLRKAPFHASAHGQQQRLVPGSYGG